MKNYYTQKFYNNQYKKSLQSAEQVIPFIMGLISPASIVDIGCGIGTWLKPFIDRGVTDVIGVDGDYINKDKLCIPKEKFFSMDLKKPIYLERKFDLAISLEVAEHIPDEFANQFVKGLTDLSGVVLFSAAIPFQGGTNHLNEQWQSYWAVIFQEYGFTPINYIREKIWNNKNVLSWYKQNIVMYINNDLLKKQDLFKNCSIINNFSLLDCVHPETLLNVMLVNKITISQILHTVRAFPNALWRKIKK